MFSLVPNCQQFTSRSTLSAGDAGLRYRVDQPSLWADQRPREPRGIVPWYREAGEASRCRTGGSTGKSGGHQVITHMKCKQSLSNVPCEIPTPPHPPAPSAVCRCCSADFLPAHGCCRGTGGERKGSTRTLLFKYKFVFTTILTSRKEITKLT